MLKKHLYFLYGIVIYFFTHSRKNVLKNEEIVT